MRLDNAVLKNVAIKRFRPVRWMVRHFTIVMPDAWRMQGMQEAILDRNRMKEETASEILRAVQSASTELLTALNAVQQDSDWEEAENFKKQIATVLADLFDQFIGPVYKTFPNLCPPEFHSLMHPNH